MAQLEPEPRAAFAPSACLIGKSIEGLPVAGIMPEKFAGGISSVKVKSLLTAHVTSVDTLATAQRSGLLWVALGSAGDPVGFALASICGRRVHLDELDVLPEHGRKGVGSALVETVEHWALHSDYIEITLTTFRDVPWNAPFYAHIGFVVIPEGELDADLLRRLSDESAMGLERARRVAMRKSLGRLTSAST